MKICTSSKDNAMNNKLFKKFLEFGVGSVITLLIGFISSPIITRLVSPEQNGKFSMFSTVGNLILVVVVLGLDQSFVRFFYDEKEENRGKLLKVCIIIPMIISIITSIILIIFYKPISSYIVGEKSLIVILLLCVYLIINVVFRFASLQIRMSQKAKLYSVVNIIQKCVNLIVVIFMFFLTGNNYITLVIALVVSFIAASILAIIFEKDVWLKKHNNIGIATSKRELIRYGIPLIFSMAITWIFQSTDRIAIKGFVGYEELGLYNGAMTIIALLNAVQNTFTTFWTPVAFERYSNDSQDKQFFKNINEIVTISMLIIAIVLISSKDIIVYLLGPKYREAMFIFPYLVFMPVMYTISETTVLGINFKKKPKEHIKIASIVAIFNIIGNILLVPKLGARGAAISTGLAYSLFFLLRTYFSNKYFEVDYKIKKFLGLTIIIYILATYSSFNKFNEIIFLLSLISIITTFFVYKNIIYRIILDVKNELDNRR
ncbi:oligosaccharide flippase family protein [Clostridium perfringens]